MHLQSGRPQFNPWVGKLPWRRTWQPTPVSCLENPMDRGAWRATVHGLAKSWDMTERLSTQSLFNRFCDEEWAPKLTADGLRDNEMPRWDTHWTLWTHCSSHHHWAHWVSHSRIKLHPLVYSSPTQIIFKEYTYLFPRKFLEPQNN